MRHWYGVICGLLLLGGLAGMFFTHVEAVVGEEGSLPPAHLPSAQTANIELVGQLGGASYAVATDGTWLYAAVGPRLMVFDVSDPANPLPVGQTDVLPDMVMSIKLVGTYAYITALDSGLCIVDISAPTQPVVVGYYNSGAAVGAAVSAADVAGDYAYLAVADGSLRIVDIATPSAPVEVGVHYGAGIGYSVAVIGPYVYFGVGNAVRIVDVSQPLTPTLVGLLDLEAPVLGITFSGARGYLANEAKGLRILDITNVTMPIESGFYDTPGSAQRVVVSGNYAYVADRERGVRVLNIANPAAPVSVGVYQPADYDHVYDVAVSGTRLYVAARYTGVRITNLATNPAQPTELGSYARLGYVQSVAVDGAYAYAAAGTFGVHALSLHAPATPRWLGRLVISDGFAGDVKVRGRYAYIAAGRAGVRVLDVSSPTALVEVGAFTGRGWAYETVLREHMAYVANSGSGAGQVNGVLMLDLTNPIAPQEAGWRFSSGTPRGVDVSGDFTYLACDTAGLWVFDLNNPYQFNFYDKEKANAVAVREHYAYVTDNHTLHILDVSQPYTIPTYVRDWSTPGGAQGITIAGDYAVVADGHRGIRVLDLSQDPENPVEIGYYDTPGIARKITVVDRYLYVADGQGGIMILWLKLEGSAIIEPPGGEFEMPDGTTYIFPTDSFSDTVILFHSPRTPSGVPATAPLVGIEHFFDVTAVYSDTGQPATLLPGMVYTVSIPYTERELGVAREATLALYGWAAPQWTALALYDHIDLDANIFTAVADRLGLFGVLGETHRVYLPLIMRRY